MTFNLTSTSATAASTARLCGADRSAPRRSPRAALNPPAASIDKDRVGRAAILINSPLGFMVHSPGLHQIAKLAALLEVEPSC
jgi:hypothetical protein